MKIKSIYIDGLHNAIDKTYEFGDIVYLFGKNGAGKSTVLNAIQLALLGYIPGTSKTKDAILRHSPKYSITVELRLDDVTITRKISKSGNNVTLNPEDYNLSKIIESLELPIFNFNEFVGQTANKLKEYFIKNILPTTDGKLNWKDILTESIEDLNFEDKDEILQYGLKLVDADHDSLLDQVVATNAKLKEEQSFNKSELQRLQNTIDSLIYYDDYTGPTNMEEITAKLLSLGAFRDQKIKYESAAQAMKSSEEELASLTAKLDAMGGKETYDKINSELSMLKQSEITISNKVNDKNNEILTIRAADNQSDVIINSGGICPYTKDTCKSIAAQIDVLRNASAKRKAALVEAQLELGNYNTHLKDIQDKIRSHESIIMDFHNIWNRIEVLQKTLGGLPDNPAIDKTIQELDIEIDSLTKSKMKLQANIQYNVTIDNLTKLKYEIEMQSKALANWIKKTDTNGLQTTLMEKPFEELANTMTNYIRQMYGRTDIKAHFNISNKANSFSFGLVRDNIYIPYDLLSSGEKCLYTLALMICINSTSKSPLKIMLCDDMFDHLDPIAIDNTFLALKNIKDIQFIFAGVQSCKSAEDVIIKIS